MDQDRFESEVVALAAEGVKLTVANVAARTRMPLGSVEERLDAMVGTQRLDSEIDEAHGFVFYRVRGLDPAAARSRLAVLEQEVERGLAAVVPRVRPVVTRMYGVATEGRKEKSVVAGIVLAMVFGPLGLLYAGPLEEVAIGFVGFLAILFGTTIPLLGRLVGMVVPFVWMAAIANGHRTGLLARRGGRFARFES
jgi:hypothetical protein